MGAIIYYSSVLADKDLITVGEIAAFLLYMILLIGNFAIIALVSANVFKVIGASKKVVSLMQVVPAINTRGGKILERVQGTIEFKNVDFCYPTK